MNYVENGIVSALPILSFPIYTPRNSLVTVRGYGSRGFFGHPITSHLYVIPLRNYNS